MLLEPVLPTRWLNLTSIGAGFPPALAGGDPESDPKESVDGEENENEEEPDEEDRKEGVGDGDVERVDVDRDTRRDVRRDGGIGLFWSLGSSDEPRSFV